MAQAPAIGGNLVNIVQQASVAMGTPVVYEVVFQNEWTASRHPKDYPNDAHWSPAVTATHDDTYQMWTGGEKASTGVKSVAETGSTTQLKSELTKAGSAVGNVKTGPLLFPKDGKPNTQTFDFEIDMDSDHYYISTVSMIADSPDWFAGFHDLKPIDGDDYWYESFTVESWPYDSGTDSGDTYLSRNSVTDPVEDIFRIQGAPFKNNGEVLPVATWTFTLISSETGSCKDVGGGDVPTNRDGSKTRSCRDIGRKNSLRKRVCKPGKPAWEMCPVTCGNDCSCEDTSKRIRIDSSTNKRCRFLDKKGNEEIKEKLCMEGKAGYKKCPVTCGRKSCSESVEV